MDMVECCYIQGIQKQPFKDILQSRSLEILQNSQENTCVGTTFL